MLVMPVPVRFGGVDWLPKKNSRLIVTPLANAALDSPKEPETSSTPAGLLPVSVNVKTTSAAAGVPGCQPAFNGEIFPAERGLRRLT
jgi:hypothetical protein